MKKTHLLLIFIIVLASILRLYNLSSNPTSLYWDEASIGYNAFSILKSGIDEHGNKFPLTHFLAYGDAKPPLYIYATSVSMAIFGINNFAVRFPSAFAGILAILITYLLIHQIFPNKKYQYLGLTTAFLLSISPWHLQMSRAAYEANLALTLFLFANFFFFKGLKNPKYWLVSAPLYISTLYTFNSYRIFLPFYLLILGLLYLKQLRKNFKFSLLSILLAATLVAPLIPFVLSDQAKLRFEEVTIFKNQQPIIDANTRIQLNNNALWAKIIYNRRLLFGLEFIQHYTDHFKPNFLFFSGDVNPRLSVRDVGEMYFLEIPFVLIGLFVLIKSKNKQSALIISWILLSIIPAAMARETPHALRILQILPAPQILVALGILTTIKKIPKIRPIIILSYIIVFSFYLHLYHIQYPKVWSNSWQYGYEPMIDYITSVQDQYDKIFVTNKLGRPHTYMLFYTQYSPRDYIQNRDAGGDAFGFTYTNSFDKYYFTPPPQKTNQQENWLIVSDPESAPPEDSLKTIYNLNQEPVFVINKQ